MKTKEERFLEWLDWALDVDRIIRNEKEIQKSKEENKNEKENKET